MITDSTAVYLKPNTVIEPLFNRWYAWAHLVSPATAAMNTTGRHMRIMDSYIQAPQIHQDAAKNPKMLGGPFMDFGRNRVEEIRELQAQTIKKQYKGIELTDAIHDLEEMLAQYGNGYSLEPLYEKVPEALKGYVELLYDLNSNPTYRFFESLLYKSEFYDASLQSIYVYLTENDERPFVLSTPRLDADNALHFDIPFNSVLIDELAKMKRNAKPFSYIKKLFSINEKDEVLFASFFTEEAPPVYEKYTGDKLRMRYFGHACILVETKDVSILVDPLISYYGYNQDVEHYSDCDIPDVLDYVLITHNHQDHILFETLLPLRHKIKKLVIPKTTSGSLQDPNLRLMFEELGFDNIIELGEMENISFNDCTITGIPFIGEHSDLNIQAKICHHIQAGQFSMLFAADSCNVEPRLYQHVHKLVGDVDVVFLGMECDGAPLSWLYGPLLTKELDRARDYSRKLAGSNFERGKALVDAFNPQEVYVYAMGLEPWLEFISSIRYTSESNPIVASNKLVAYCKNKGVISERLFGEKELLYNKSMEEVEIAR
jgi:L-ascorbate metabolism protein UlaG (beta-lactamase superfamily)